MKLIWSPLAVEQIRNIVAYIAQDNPPVAKQWANKIFNAVKRLIEHPKSGRIVPEINRKEIREIIQGSYRIIYKIKQEQILILTVKNTYQLLKKDEL